MLAVPRGHPLSRPGPVRWREIAPHRLILPTRGSGNRTLIDRALARHRLTLFWSVEAARTASSLEMVRTGIGVAPLPLAAVPLGDSDGYALRELTEPEVTRRFGLVTRQTGTLAADAARLRDMVVSRATSTP